MKPTLHDELLREFRRICPDQEAIGFSFLGLNPAVVLEEWRTIPSGAGEVALGECVERLVARLYGLADDDSPA